MNVFFREKLEVPGLPGFLKAALENTFRVPGLPGFIKVALAGVFRREWFFKKRRRFFALKPLGVNASGVKPGEPGTLNV
ncbi:MAG: hypothetical protein WD708_08855, partial [Kiritimatiellia bacterium]